MCSLSLIQKTIACEKLDSIVSSLKNGENQSIVLSDFSIAPVLCSVIPQPFAYIVPDKESATEAETVFKNLEANTCVHIADTLLTKITICENKIFVINKDTKYKQLLQVLVDFGYEKHHDYTVRGDVIDIDNKRIIFYGENVESLNESFEIKSKKMLERVVIDTLPKTLVLVRPREIGEVEQFKKFNIIKFDSRGEGLHLNSVTLPNYYNATGALVSELSKKQRALVFVGNSKTLTNYLREKSIQLPQVDIINKGLGVSFEINDVSVYSTTEHKHMYKETRPIKAVSFSLPQIGKVVVHDFHGLGRYCGIEKMDLGSGTGDYIVLQYEGGAHVYLPVSQSGMLSNYHGEPTRLSRIGGKDFAATKARIKKRLRELTFELSHLYARRSRAKANKYEWNEPVMNEFRNDFKHILTPDQIEALDDIKDDMISGKVMDRLVVGDVGYGKTELAMHAAFSAILNGFQVALLCPTTILSVQHYDTAKARLGKFGVRVDVLNRFRTDREVDAIINGLAGGDIDLVIGTHRLISSDIGFKNLGLLVLDEEQRFGVAHKERIKQLKTNIDVLTLSATPIPRTLKMALTGIRDISNITTPPPNRLSVITQVCEYSDELVASAIEFEYKRGGQTLVLFNNVERIEHFVAVLAKNLAESDANQGSPPRVAIVHGQMSDTKLEDTILAMYRGEIDVLVASTIIENGIDIHTANTLIVIDSDRLGVAQMHQLRGRVGRGKEQAYAYFTYAKEKDLSEISRERLGTIQRYSGVGSGFNIAMRDLELRGAGDLLGAEQSGHIEQVGMETYLKILKEVRAELSLDL